MSQKYKLAIVHWVDSSRYTGWERLEHLQSTPKKCISVGFIIYHDKETISVAPHVSDSPAQACGTMVIPKLAVTSIKYLGSTWEPQ